MELSTYRCDWLSASVGCKITTEMGRVYFIKYRILNILSGRKCFIAVVIVILISTFSKFLIFNGHQSAFVLSKFSNPSIVKPSTGPNLELLHNLGAMVEPKINIAAWLRLP